MLKHHFDTSLKYDAIILGGGLAGLGLAKQIKNGAPELSILILEKASFPRPQAIAKVGESTVEIGSQYLANELGLSEFLKTKQLKKFGIRIFFSNDGDDFEKSDELGASQTFGIPTYQIDRGDIENKLVDDLRALGVTIIDKTTIESVEIKALAHSVNAVVNSETYQFQCRWLLDASGRAGIIKQHKNLDKKNAHQSNAIWFRVKKEIKIDTWSACENWRLRCKPTDRRWLSTNHLVGPGYWVWIIPLSSGITSIGVVMDNTVYSETDWQHFDNAFSWLEQKQPRLAQEIRGIQPLDYVALSDYSYDCAQFFSNEGWAITGEAGAFADPLYSPGSDFIAIANTLISNLVINEYSGENITVDTVVFEKVYRSIYENTLSLYSDQYGGFGDRKMMGLKLLWDYSYYWGVLSLLFFRKAFTDFDVLRSVSKELAESQKLNEHVQACFRAQAKKRHVAPSLGMFMNQYDIPCLQHFNRILEKPPETNITEDLKQNVSMLHAIAQSIIDMFSDDATQEISETEAKLLGNYRSLILQ